MGTIQRFLPGFKATCYTVGTIDVLVSVNIFVRGIMASMAEFGVPAEMLASPHYYDAMKWVYVHSAVLGSVMICLGWCAGGIGLKAQQRLSALFATAHALYLWLDIRSSDSAWGTGLYKGEASLIPAIIGFVLTLLWAQLSLNLFLRGSQPENPA